MVLSIDSFSLEILMHFDLSLFFHFYVFKYKYYEIMHGVLMHKLLQFACCD